MNAFVLLMLAIIFNVTANYLLKAKATSIDTSSLLGQLSSLPFLWAMMFFGANMILYSRALKSIDLSYAYPILVGSSIVAIYLLSLFFLEERVSWTRLGGSVLVVAGVLLVSIEGKL